MLKAIPGISKKFMAILVAALFLVSMVFFVSPGKIFGATLTVESGGTYATIQAAINAASNGDTIQIAAGDYTGPITINKGLMLQAQDMSNPPIVTGGFQVTANDVTIKGFKVKAGLILGETVCVYLSSPLSNIEISHNEFYGDGSSAGKGVIITTSGTYSNVYITYNKIHDLATGIYTNPHTGTVNIENNEIYNTIAGIGGATGANIKSNVFSNNDEAIGVDDTYSDVTIQLNDFNINNTFGIRNYGSKIVYATNNWWGSADPTGNAVSANVNFDPWYINAEMTILSDYQAAPTGLAGVAPTSALNDGKITGTTTAMEYKLSAATNYTAVTGTEITNLAAGDYVVRLAAKNGFNAGATTAVTVPAYIAPAPSTGGGGGTTTAAPAITVLGITELGLTEGGSTTDFVTRRLYRSILLRDPDAAGLAGWVDALTNGGLTGEDVVRGFIYSDELKLYLASLDNTGYLNFLYNRVFGREADLDGLNGWLTNMAGGMTREEVLDCFLNCPEWYTICDAYGITP